MCGTTEDFRVGVHMHQGSALSHLFSVVTDDITMEIQAEVLWCMMFADDIVLIRKIPEEVNNRLEE